MPRLGLPMISIAATLAAQPSSAQDRALVVPDMKVLLNNDCVRVQRHDVDLASCLRRLYAERLQSGDHLTGRD